MTSLIDRPVPTAADLVARIEELQPMLRANAAQGEPLGPAQARVAREVFMGPGFIYRRLLLLNHLRSDHPPPSLCASPAPPSQASYLIAIGGLFVMAQVLTVLAQLELGSDDAAWAGAGGALRSPLAHSPPPFSVVCVGSASLPRGGSTLI